MSTSEQTRWLGPQDAWPTHGDTWFRALLDDARDRGWWFKKPGDSSHIFGTAYCHRPDSLESPCKYVVFSTGRGGESASSDLKRLLQRCPHRKDDPLAAADARMDGISNLIRAAGALLDQRDHEQEMFAMLDRAQELTDLAEEEIDRILSAASDEEGESNVAAAEAAQILTSLDLEEREPAALVGLAEGAAGLVRDDLLRVEPPSRAKAAKVRLKGIQTQLRALRSRLSEG